MANIEKLLEIMAALRDPRDGCPWDVNQRFDTIAPYTVEEAYEVADAIARNDLDGLRGELGDLLFQVVFHARMAEEAGAFDFAGVVDAISDKLERRHPHVFGTEEERRRGPEPGSWERIKADERLQRRGSSGSVLDDIPAALPALKRAAKLGQRAAATGFDWPAADGPRQKVAEELGELDTAIANGSAERVADEFGDVLFSMVNVARHLGLDAEQALTEANRKFEGRFRHMEASAASRGLDLAALDPEALEALWQEAKNSLA